MEQPSIPEGHRRHSFVCGQCQAVLTCTSLGCREAAEAAAHALGGRFSRGAFYCPECAIQLGHTEISKAAVGQLDAQASGPAELASADEGTGTPSTASAPPTPPAAAGDPSPGERVIALLREMQDLDLELGENHHHSQKLEGLLRNCHMELRALLGF